MALMQKNALRFAASPVLPARYVRLCSCLCACSHTEHGTGAHAAARVCVLLRHPVHARPQTCESTSTHTHTPTQTHVHTQAQPSHGAAPCGQRRWQGRPQEGERAWREENGDAGLERRDFLRSASAHKHALSPSSSGQCGRVCCVHYTAHVCSCTSHQRTHTDTLPQIRPQTHRSVCSPWMTRP